MIKTIFVIMIALSLAYSQVCRGFSQDSGKTCLGGSINKCTAYAAPIYLAGSTVFKCTACDPAYQLSEDGLSCNHKYDAFTRIYGGEIITYSIQKYWIAAGLLDDYDYSNISCAIEGQIVLACNFGYVYSETEFKCLECTATNCLKCGADDLAKCTVCDISYVLTATGTCTQCSEFALTCASETEAETCAPGSFFNATTKKCIACGTNMATCTAVDKALTCDDSFYKNGDACTGCGTNQARCTSATAITECVRGTSTDYIYYYNSSCTAHAKSNNCLTLTGDAPSELCATCISGYTLSTGVCVACTTFVSTSDSDDCSVATITAGTTTTAATVTACSAGWYLATAGSGGTDGLCNPCPTGCLTCEAGSSTITCLSVSSTANTHYIDDASVVKGCAEAATGGTPAGDAEIATCTVSGTTITILSCLHSKEYLFTETNTTFVTPDSPAWTCVANDSSNANHCATYNKNAQTPAAAYKCLSCVDDYAYKTTYSDAAFTGGNETAFTCVAVSTDATEAWYACLTMKYNSTGPTYSCESCVGPAFHLTTTATAKRCKLLANCTLMGTATTCSDCDDGYTLTTIGTCVQESINNCATYAVAAAAKCATCEAGYYFTSDAQTACSNSAVTNCLVLSPTMTGTKDCFACNQGFKWNTTSKECTACNATDNICKTTGCADIDYPLKPEGNTTPAAGNSALIVFILSTLVALMTIFI